jgi:hypothetical protein
MSDLDKTGSGAQRAMRTWRVAIANRAPRHLMLCTSTIACRRN